MESLDANSFDFWIGEWDCTFEGGTATNTVAREYNGHVISERFDLFKPRSWSGMSVSVWSSDQDMWRQTWVDESGSYWNFAGTLVDGNPSFATPDRVDADQLYKRMIFTNITIDAFDWRWESSPDGVEWTEHWALAYWRQK
jgi:hypothetical protein